MIVWFYISLIKQSFLCWECIRCYQITKWRWPTTQDQTRLENAAARGAQANVGRKRRVCGMWVRQPAVCLLVHQERDKANECPANSLSLKVSAWRAKYKTGHWAHYWPALGGRMPARPTAWVRCNSIQFSALLCLRPQPRRRTHKEDRMWWWRQGWGGNQHAHCNLLASDCYYILVLGQDSRILAWVMRLTLLSGSAAWRRWLVGLQVFRGAFWQSSVVDEHLHSFLEAGFLWARATSYQCCPTSLMNLPFMIVAPVDTWNTVGKYGRVTSSALESPHWRGTCCWRCLGPPATIVEVTGDNRSNCCWDGHIGPGFWWKSHCRDRVSVCDAIGTIIQNNIYRIVDLSKITRAGGNTMPAIILG